MLSWPNVGRPNDLMLAFASVILWEFVPYHKTDLGTFMAVIYEQAKIS
jgi:hypothetical protein